MRSSNPLNNPPQPYEKPQFPFAIAALTIFVAAIAITMYNFMVYDSRYYIYAALLLYFCVPVVAFFGFSQQKYQTLTTWIFGIGIIPAGISTCVLLYVMS